MPVIQIKQGLGIKSELATQLRERERESKREIVKPIIAGSMQPALDEIIERIGCNKATELGDKDEEDCDLLPITSARQPIHKR